MKKNNLFLTGGVLTLGVLALGTGFVTGNSLTANANVEPEVIYEATGNGEWALGFEEDAEAIGFFFRDLDVVASDLQSELGGEVSRTDTLNGHLWEVAVDNQIHFFHVEEVFGD